MTILVTDDEELVRYDLTEILKSLLPDAAVYEAENGRELVSMTGSYAPDLAFVDIRLPGMNGLDALAKLREGSVKTKFVILTGYADFQYAKEAITLGVKEYLLKPATEEEVRQVIDKLFPDAFGRVTAGERAVSQQDLVDKSLVTVRQAEKIGLENFTESFGVNEAAEQLGITPNYLSRQFKRWRKISYTKYLTNLRMEEAKKMLLEPGARVADVSTGLGYSSSRYFARIFADYYSLTPSEYMRINREE